MALDSLTAVGFFPQYFPEFARSELEFEYQCSLARIWDYLNQGAEFLCTHPGTFMHLMRLLTALPDDAVRDFPSKSRLVLSLWDLYCCDALTRTQRTRLVDVLVTLLCAVKTHHHRPIWMHDTACSLFVRDHEIQELGNRISWRVLFDTLDQRFQQRGYRGPVDISCATRKATIGCVARLASACRHFWNSEAVGQELQDLLNFKLPLDFTKSFLFYQTRVLALFVGRAFWHKSILSGDLFRWWSPLSERTSQSWDAVFAGFFYRGVKHGWATGAPVYDASDFMRPFVFQLLSSSLFLPTARNLTASFVKDNVPGEYTVLLLKQPHLLRKLAKVIALLLPPLDGPVRLNGSALTATNTVGVTVSDNVEDQRSVSVRSIWENLEALLSVAFPLTHPSHGGKWTGPISQFIDALVLAYTRRVARERMSTCVVPATVGRLCSSDKPLMSYRLGRREDEKLTELLLPLLLQGMYSKSLNASTAYETAIKRLCYLLPDVALPTVLERILAALETVTESHQVQSAFRLLSQLCSLVLQRAPELVADLLTLSLPGIDSGDPFKTVQVLTFYVVLLGQMAAQDFSDVDVNSVPFEQISETIRRYLFPRPGESSPFISWHNYPIETLKAKKNALRSTRSAKGGTSKHSQTATGSTTTTAQPESVAQQFWSPEQMRNRLSSVLMAASVIPTWAQEFLTQLLRLCSHSVKLDKNAGGVMSSVDRSFGVAMKLCLGLLLSECDETLFVQLCEMYRDWLLSNMIPDATKLAAMVCRTFSQSRPHLAFRILFHPIVLRLPIPDDNASSSTSTILPSSTEETVVLWYMNSLSNLFRADPKAFVPYRRDIVRVVRWAITHANKNVASIGIKCLRRVVESTYLVTADPGGAFSPVDRSAPLEVRVLSALRWGNPWWLSHVQSLEELSRCTSKTEKFKEVAGSIPNCKTEYIEWRVPSEPSAHFANYLVALGLRCIEELLHYCIPQPNHLLRATSSSSFDKRNDALAAGTTLEDTALQLHRRVPYGALDLPDLSDFQLNMHLVGQPPRKLLQRVLSLGRHLLKGLSPLFPDERAMKTAEFPIISPVSENHSIPVVSFLADLCLTVSRFYLGLSVDSDAVRVNHVAPLVELRGTEDSVLIRKLLRAMDQLLSRPWCAGSQHAQSAFSGKLWASLGSWISATSGVHSYSEYQDMLRSTWAERLLHQWMLRTEERRIGHAFSGYRRSLLTLVARFGTHYYAENRKLAQDILHNAFGYHYGARRQIIRMFTWELRDEVARLSAQTQLKEAPESIAPAKTHLLSAPQAKLTSESSPQLTTDINDVSPTTLSYLPPPVVVPASKFVDQGELEDVELELCYARITGVTYCLNRGAMLGRVWGTPELVRNALWATCGCFKAPIARDKLQSRLVTLAHGMLSHRERLRRNDPDFSLHIVKGLLFNILEDLRGGSSGNWRYQLVTTAILASFNSPLIPELEEDYALWLISACNPSTYSPLLNTLALFSLTIYLTPKLSDASTSSSGSFGSKFPDSVRVLLSSNETVASIANALVHAHHESSRSTPASYPETAYQLVLDILKVDTTWPTSRLARESRHLSVHNCLTVSTLVGVQKKLVSQRSTADILEPWMTHIRAFFAFPPGESEYHLTACELIAGILSVAFTWDLSDYQEAWHLLHPLLLNAFHALDQEKFLDFLDALHFAIDEAPLRLDHMLPSDYQKRPERSIPLQNLALHLEHYPDVVTVSADPPPLFQFSDSGKSSLEDTKRLKFIVVLLQQAQHNALPLTRRLFSAIPSLLIHPYKQIRYEVSRCVAYALHILQANESAESKCEYQKLCGIITTLGQQYHAYLDAHYLDEAPRDLSVQRPDPLFGAESLMLIAIFFFRHLLDTKVPQCILDIFTLFFDAIKYPDFTLNTVGVSALSYVALRAGASGDYSNSIAFGNKQLPPTLLLNVFVDALESQSDSASWKIRQTTIRLVEILCNKYRMIVHKTDYYHRLVRVCIKCLTDQQSEVRDQARCTLSSLAVSMSSEDYASYTKQFVSLAEGSNQQQNSHTSGTDVQLMGGVLGLTALILSAPYHVPDWLPSTITKLAQYGKSKSPDNVKRQVEKSLQEFFRTHQDAWQQSHVKRFSEDQIELLDMYKGRPVYFG